MNQTVETADIVHQITEKDDGTIMVSFLHHDGYFRIGDDAAREAIKAQLARARDAGTEVRFIYDAQLHIRSVL